MPTWLGLPNWARLRRVVLALALAWPAALLCEAIRVPLPRPLTNAGQLFIGVSLGSRFTPAFARAAPRWLGSVAAGTLVMIGASALFAWALAWMRGLHPATLLLATSPGGIAEMCITAKVLQLGVPVVTVFHVVRYVAVLLLTEPLFKLEARRLSRLSRFSRPGGGP